MKRILIGLLDCVPSYEYEIVNTDNKELQKKIDKIEKEAKNQAGYNICKSCDTNPQKLSVYVADTGICSKCGENTDCWDYDLINMYYQFGLVDGQISSNIPRLRHSGHDHDKRHSLESIARKIIVLTKSKIKTEKLVHGYIYKVRSSWGAEVMLCRCNVSHDGDEIWYTDKQGKEFVGEAIELVSEKDPSFHSNDDTQ